MLDLENTNDGVFLDPVGSLLPDDFDSESFLEPHRFDDLDDSQGVLAHFNQGDALRDLI